MVRHMAMLVALLLSAATAFAQAPRTKVAILGVDHATQLVSEKDQPAMLAAYLKLVKPAAICIERPPAPAARGDFYEYTYEVQGVILPFAKTHPTALCPIDWMPPIEDQKLGFGLDVETPLEVRKAQGFQGFLTFPDKKVLAWDFFSAEDPKTVEAQQQWAREPAPRADRDLPRRLYLYRTFMQAQNIRAAARAHRGETLLVVVGYFHKPDIEAILKHDGDIELVSPASLGRPTPEQVREATTDEQRAAILAFNLLGMQAATGNVDWGWIERVLGDFAAGKNKGEAELFRTRHAVLTGKLSQAEAARRYTVIADDPAAAVSFTWNGVQDRTRIDSFFDPFGNLDVRQRARIERARSLFAQGKDQPAAQELDRVAAALSPRMALQLRGYTAILRPVLR